MMVIRGSLERAVRALRADRDRLTRKVVDLSVANEKLAGSNQELRRTIARLNACEEARRG